MEDVDINLGPAGHNTPPMEHVCVGGVCDQGQSLQCHLIPFCFGDHCRAKSPPHDPRPGKAQVSTSLEMDVVQRILGVSGANTFQ